MQNMLQSVSDALLQLYEGVQHCPPDQLQKDTLNNLKQLISYDYAFIGGGWAPDRRITDLTVVGQSQSLMVEWMSIGHLDPFCDKALSRLGQAWRFSDIPDYLNSLAYNEHWRNFDVADMIGTISNEPMNDYVSFLGLCRNADSTPYTEQELQLKRVITPHITQALRTNRQVYLQGIKADNQGVALVDRAGVIMTFRGNVNKVMQYTWKQSRRFPDSVMKGLRESGAWRGDEFQFKSCEVGPYLLVSVEVSQPADCLTPREFEAATLFASGLTYKQVAREMGNSPATVRNQVVHIYDKLNVRSKAELATCLAKH